MRLQLEMTVFGQPLQIRQKSFRFIQALGDKGVGLLAQFTFPEQLAVNLVDTSAQLAKRLQPRLVVITGTGKQPVHAWLTIFFVFEQQVSQSAVGGNHKDPVINIFVTAVSEYYVVTHGFVLTHRSTADLLYGV